MSQKNRELWNGLVPRASWRQTAINLLKNHFEEVLALNGKIESFYLSKNGKQEKLSTEDFLLLLAHGSLPYQQKAVDHLRLIAGQWPVGTVLFEHLPLEKNPYSKENSSFPYFKAKTHEELCAKELVSENRDLLLQTISQGREAAKLGLTELDCELQDEVLKEAWIFGFKKELEKQQLNQEEKLS